jgi:pimeloyl-ACP methyl ester carboxylesterase
MPELNRDTVLAATSSDVELAYKLRGFSGRVRIGLLDTELDVVFHDGAATAVEEPSGAPEIELRGTPEFWRNSLSAALPRKGYESLTAGAATGLSVHGDMVRVVAPWFGGWQRLYLVLRAIAVGPLLRRPFRDPFRATDNAIGRYVYVRANGLEARMYYETAGSGRIPLLLQATAGADSRQYRHMLADPRLQQRFTMYAFDLPYHGRSLPPIGVRWWEQPYAITQAEMANWVVALADALELRDPYFMGCSVGGQLALDLAAEDFDRFGAFISLNGWYDLPALPPGFNNERFRTPEISSDYAPQLNFGGTAPTAPEPNAHETYWIYRSAFPGIYAGDNDYFCYGHDLKQNGHKIDAHAKPVYVVTGDYESAAHSTVHGAPAVERNIPGARHVHIAGLGHFAPSDDPVLFNDSILPVLDEIIARTHPRSASADDAVWAAPSLPGEAR